MRSWSILPSVKRSFEGTMSLFGEWPDPCANETIPPSYISFTTASVSSLLCIITITGNILVVLAIFIDPNKDLKSPFNYFVANLAIADFLVGFVVEPIAVGIHISEGISRQHRLNVAFLHIPFFMSCTASVLSLAALTMDRFVALTSPLYYVYSNRLNPKRAAFVAAGIWTFSLSFPFIYFVTDYKAYAFVLAHTVIILTFLVMLVTYVKIFRVFRNQVKQLDSMDAATEDSNLPSRRELKWEQNVTKTFLIMLGLFLACYLPSCVFVYIANFCYVCSCNFIQWSRDGIFLFILANSGVNPFVYAWQFENFRQAFAKLLTCRICCRRHGGYEEL